MFVDFDRLSFELKSGTLITSVLVHVFAFLCIFVFELGALCDKQSNSRACG